MVVVLGGVGQLAGTVYAGLGLGVLNKLLEGWQGAVLAKITVLAFIVIFIQKRPQGLFALKGRVRKQEREEGPHEVGIEGAFASGLATTHRLDERRWFGASRMSAVLALESPRGVLLGPRAWTAMLAAAATITVLIPLLNLVVPQASPFHFSDYYVSLTGKILYVICALAMDLIWGYTGILSLGHGLFFALGGYAMGMYLMRQIGRDGQYRMDMPDFMVFLNWKTYPWHWTFSDSFLFQMAMVVLVPALLAFVFGFFAFRSRIKGVYLLLDHHAGADLRRDAALLPQRDRLRRQQRLHRLQAHPRRAGGHPAMRVLLCVITGAVLIGFFLMARAIVNSKYGRVLQAIRDAESRVTFTGYNPVAYKLSIWTLSAAMCGVAGALYVPQVGIINPGEMSPAASIEIAIWAAVGGRATLIGPIIGAFFVNGAKSWFTVAFPEFCCTSWAPSSSR